MCITVGPASLSSTRIYVAETRRPDGDPCHVIGYQNVVASDPGPNAMLLPFPAKGLVTPDNLVNGSRFPTILEAYERAIQRQHAPRSMTMSMGAAAADDFTVFESGSYTVALAQKPSALKSALELVPESRRPVISTSFIIALARYYPGWPIALCCFEGVPQRDEPYGVSMAPEPLFWWYTPRDPAVFFAPALDAHDGRPPEPGIEVARDHVVAFGSHIASMRRDERLRSDIDVLVPPEHRWMFVDRVHGGTFQGTTRNGDFLSSVDETRHATHAALVKIAIVAPARGDASQ